MTRDPSAPALPPEAERWLEGLEVVCLSHLAWRETLFQRPHHWMSRFARHCPAVAWACPLSFRLLGNPGRLAREGIEPSGRWGGGSLAFRHVRYVPLTGRLDAARRLTNRNLARAARGMLGERPPEGRRRLVWIQYPPFIEAAEALAPDFLAVDVMDPYRDFPGSPRAGVAESTRHALERAGAVFAGGHSMAEGMEWLGDKLRVVPSGVEVERFARAPRLAPPAEGKPGFVAGYAGSVDERIDWPLVRRLAEELPEIVWEFAGPIQPGAERLGLPNVRCLGPVPYAELPGLFARWSAGTLPFRDDELCRGLSPTKIPEYLAAGLPTLSTPLPDVVRDWGRFCRTPAGPAEWADALRALLDGDAPPLDDPAEALLAASWDAKFAEVVGRLMARA